MRASPALVVGIDDYPGQRLSGCVADAAGMAELLARNADGSKNFHVQLLTSDRQRVTRSLLLERVRALLAQPADVALLYFAGHGLLSDFGGHLVTVDAEQDWLGVSDHQLATLIQESPVREIVVLLDCCDSGAFGSATGDGPDLSRLRHGVTIMTASRPAQPAVERDGGGVFTRALRDALAGGAADVVGRVTTAGIYAYLDESLGPWDQRPMFKAHLSSLTDLRRCEPAVPPTILRELATWFDTPTGEFPLDPSYEPDADPSHPVHEAVFARLQACRAARLVEPVGTDHMYYAAMESRSCRLTPLGQRYWRLVNEDLL